MKKILIYIVFALLAEESTSQIWFAKNVQVRFFSATPLEDIEAINKYASAALNAKTGKIYFKAMMKSFQFEKALMQEHFNENYVESDKFPSAEFDGMIVDVPDLTVDGDYVVKLKGKLSLHGVSIEKEMNGNLKVAGGKIVGASKFKVKCSEYNIRVPSVVRKNINEDIEVTIHAVFMLKKG